MATIKAVITGASSGIGKEIALTLAKEGYRLVLSYNRGLQAIQETLQACRQAGSKDPLALPLDLCDTQSLQKFSSQALNHFGGELDVLVNNAAVNAPDLAIKPFIEQSIEDIGVQIRANLEGTLVLTRLLLRHTRIMVLNVGSQLSKVPMAQMSVYCATKYGLRGFTQALALECPRLKIYLLNPDLTATRATQWQGRDPKATARLALKLVQGTLSPPSGSDIDVWQD